MTPAHMTRARERAEALGDARLAAHFRHKLGEELGHEVWAEEDLRSLQSERIARTDVLESARNLARSNEALIEDHPALYLVYIAFVEYFTAIHGPAWLQLLEERCGIPQSSMTAVGKHAELDREHAEEGFAVLDDLVEDPAMLPRMRAALSRSIALFEAQCAEVVSGPVATAAAVHVSAA